MAGRRVHRQCKILVCLYFREEILSVRYVLVSSSSEDRQRGQEEGRRRWLTQKDLPMTQTHVGNVGTHVGDAGMHAGDAGRMLDTKTHVWDVGRRVGGAGTRPGVVDHD